MRDERRHLSEVVIGVLHVVGRGVSIRSGSLVLPVLELVARLVFVADIGAIQVSGVVQPRVPGQE